MADICRSLVRPVPALLGRRRSEFEAGANAGARNSGRGVQYRREPTVLVLGAHKDVLHECNIHTAADRETVEQSRVPAVSTLEGEIRTGRARAWIAETLHAGGNVERANFKQCLATRCCTAGVLSRRRNFSGDDEFERGAQAFKSSCRVEPGR